MKRPSFPQRSSFPQIQALVALAGLGALLAACGGGGSGGGGSTAAAGTPVASEAGPTSRADPPQTAPPVASTPSASPTSPSPAARAAAGAPFGHSPDSYTLTFVEEFDGELNRSVWNTQRTETPDSTPNFAIRNGVLKIWPERGKNGAFFDRTLDTEGRFAQRYGYFETEARLPKGQGVWPAFWLYTNAGDVHREIDIMEAYPSGIPPWSEIGPDGVSTAVMYAPVVWTTSQGATGFAKVPTPDLAAGFHRYGAKWEPERITFYFDGREVLVVNAAISEPLFMIIDLWFGSASGEPDGTTPTGEANSLEINYVKAWQFR